MTGGASAPSRILSSAFADQETLRDLTSGRIPGSAEMGRRLFTAARALDTSIPDHVYRDALALDTARGSGDRATAEAWDVPFTYYTRLSQHLLERRLGKIAVRARLFGAWQDTISVVSPVALFVSFLVEEGPWRNHRVDPRPFLEAELGNTALLRPVVPALEDMADRDGLHEMHMHLNGSTEADVVWAHAMRQPDVYRVEMSRAHDKESKVRELLAEIESGLTPQLFYRRLKAVRRARHVIAASFAKGDAPPSLSELARVLDAAVSDTLVDRVAGLPLGRPPSESVYGRLRSFSPLTEEAAFLLFCFSQAKVHGWRPAIGVSLHASALMFAQLSRLAVHHPSQSGFEQFQKLTMAGTRETLERSYRARFDQLSGSRRSVSGSHLEGRFAPKASLGKTALLLKSVVDGYLAHIGCRRHLVPDRGLSRIPPCLTSAGCPKADPGTPAALRGRELALVAHFIKRRSPRPLQEETELGVNRARFSTLRRSLFRQALDLRQLVRKFPLAAHLVRGIDAAANELDTPPEVFAPCFRLLRQETVAHATYHAGEDFRHLTSGIRAVKEALLYLDLGSGDRVGHATALGIDPALWLERYGPRVVVAAEDALDDAVFAHSILSDAGRSESAAKLARLVARLSVRIYDRELSPSILDAAWRLRSLDALKMVALAQGGDITKPRPDRAGLHDAVLSELDTSHAPNSRRELEMIAKAALLEPTAYKIALARHEPTVQARGAKMVELEQDLAVSDLVELQEHTLATLKNAGVVIETLPTSNLRISFYRRHGEHHLFRWLGLTGPGLRTKPDVCVGSDDPGILATSLPNEYSHLFEVMVAELGLAEADAVTMLRKLNDTGRAHRFLTSAPRQRPTEM